MTYKSNYHRRRSIRLKEYDYTSSNWYYVTICTQGRQCIFGEIKESRMILNDHGKITEEELLKTKEIRKNVDLDYYVIMPNHIHVIIIIEGNNVGAIRRVAPTLQRNSLGAIIGQFKSVVTKRINKLENHPGQSIWQRNYYEHIIRNEKDLFFTRKYIKLNPLKWELDKYYKNN